MGFMDKIYGMTQKVGDTFEKGAKNVSDGSKKVADKMRIKKEINQTEGEINSIHLQLGKKCYELNEKNPSAEYADMVNEINSKLAKIETLKNELNALEDKLPCPGCGQTVARGSKFCAGCGTDVSALFPVVEAAPEVAPAKKCTKCGYVLAEGQKFCEGCGTKVEEAPAAPAEEKAASEPVSAPVEEKPASEPVAAPAPAPEEKASGFTQAASSFKTAPDAPAFKEAPAFQSAPTPAPAPVASEKKCPQCGTKAEDDQKFCENCGTRLD